MVFKHLSSQEADEHRCSEKDSIPTTTFDITVATYITLQSENVLTSTTGLSTRQSYTVLCCMAETSKLPWPALHSIRNNAVKQARYIIPLLMLHCKTGFSPASGPSNFFSRNL
jgi:hypothetical protein